MKKFRKNINRREYGRFENLPQNTFIAVPKYRFLRVFEYTFEITVTLTTAHSFMKVI